MSKTKRFEYRPATSLRPGLAQTPDGTLFAVQAAPDSAVELLLYEAGAARAAQIISMPEEGRLGALWSVCVQIPQDREMEYLYRVDGQEHTDPCAMKIAPERPGGKKGARRALTATPVLANSKRPVCSWQDTVFYKLHVRGFTMGAGSGVKHKGTFLGLSEKLDYIRDLGITSVILMPCYEPGPDAGNNNYWGYTEGCYFAPRVAYSATGDPVKEFTKLVDDMHRAGLECLPEFWFPEQASPRHVLDVLHHWCLFYGVDGFRLLGSGTWLSAALQDAVLADRKLLCEDVSARVYSNVAQYDRQYSYAIRKFLRGDRDISVRELAFRMLRTGEGAVPVNFLADQDGFTLADVFSYNEKHNEANGQDNLDGTDYNLSWNCGAEGPTNRAQILELRESKIRSALAMLLFSQGVPMIYAGDEFMNSQEGNNNAWCQDNKTGYLNWPRQARAKALRELTCTLIQIRKESSVIGKIASFRMTDHAGLGFPDVSVHNRNAWVADSVPARDGIGLFFFGAYAAGTTKRSLYLACNPSDREVYLALPKCPGCDRWEVLVSSDNQGGEPCFAEDGNSLLIPPNSVRLLGSTENPSKGKKEK